MILSEQKESGDMEKTSSLYTEPLSMSKDSLLNTNQNFIFLPLKRHPGNCDL